MLIDGPDGKGIKDPNRARTSDGRNIIEKFFSWTNEAIKANLDERRFNYSVLCCNVEGDFNLSSVVRSSNAFLAKEVLIYGKKRFDKRGTVGTHSYTHFKHVSFKDNLDEVFAQYDVIVGVDNIDGAKPINNYQWDKNKKTLICFGEERAGLQPEVLKRCHDIIFIKQHGSVRSINVSVCAGIIMYDYLNKIGA